MSSFNMKAFFKKVFGKVDRPPVKTGKEIYEEVREEVMGPRSVKESVVKSMNSVAEKFYGLIKAHGYDKAINLLLEEYGARLIQMDELRSLLVSVKGLEEEVVNMCCHLAAQGGATVLEDKAIFVSPEADQEERRGIILHELLEVVYSEIVGSVEPAFGSHVCEEVIEAETQIFIKIGEDTDGEDETAYFMVSLRQADLEGCDLLASQRRTVFGKEDATAALLDDYIERTKEIYLSYGEEL